MAYLVTGTRGDPATVAGVSDRMVTLKAHRSFIAGGIPFEKKIQ